MIYILAALVVGFYSQMIVKFWLAVRKFGKWKETISREHHQFAIDATSIFAAPMIVYWAARDWFGFSLPFIHKAPTESWECQLMAVLSACICLTLGYFNGRNRFLNGTDAGIAEAALRYLITRQIITAAEVAAAMPYGITAAEVEAAVPSGQTIDVIAYEVRK
ncbi:hypothetical protein DVQ89_22605 [Yersinia enterocolitica]|nr:hypothetical protein [Yersinia enterocolitica]